MGRVISLPPIVLWRALTMRSFDDAVSLCLALRVIVLVVARHALSPLLYGRPISVTASRSEA
jgi:hypothetical protein